MADAYIYDHVRTPRGRGKADGALHEVTALALAAMPLQALKERNNLAEDVVDDVILGVVDPVGEAEDDVVDDVNGEIVALLQRLQRHRGERQRGDFMQRAVGLAAAARGANVIVDIGFGHLASPDCRQS